MIRRLTKSLIILFLVSCTSISNYIVVATSKRVAKKSQKWVKEIAEMAEQIWTVENQVRDFSLSSL